MSTETLAELHKAAAELNTISDAANQRIKTFEVVLAKIQVGLETWLPDRFNGIQLGYARAAHADETPAWRVVIRVLQAGAPGEPDTEVTIPLAQAGRLVRIEAAKRLNLLLEAMLQRVRDALAEATRE